MKVFQVVWDKPRMQVIHMQQRIFINVFSTADLSLCWRAWKRRFKKICNHNNDYRAKKKTPQNGTESFGISKKVILLSRWSTGPYALLKWSVETGAEWRNHYNLPKVSCRWLFIFGKEPDFSQHGEFFYTFAICFYDRLRILCTRYSKFISKVF